MGQRALEFSRAHPDSNPGYETALVRLEEMLNRAALLTDQQRNGFLEVRIASRRKRELRKAIIKGHLTHLMGVAQGAEKAVPGYNVMGVANAALESAARYLALELGARQIRVNSISAGPVRTLSAMAVGGIDEMFDHTEKKAPLHRNIEPEEVGRCAVYLLSDLSAGVTGQTIHVDCGYSAMGL